MKKVTTKTYLPHTATGILCLVVLCTVSCGRQSTTVTETNHLYHSSVVIFIIASLLAVIFILWYFLKKRTKMLRILQQMQKSREDFLSSIALDTEEELDVNTPINEHDRQFIGRFVDVVYSQMTQGKTDAESVAKQMGITRAQLNRRLMAITGQNTSSYITQIRISKAKRLLRADITKPISDIALKCGYDDVAYFSRIFKQQTDMTPSQYRKMV